GMMPMMMGRQGMMLGMLDLSDEQRARIRAIQRETASKVRRLWVQMADEADRLRDLYAAERPDPKAIGRAYSKIFDLKRQIIEARVAARNRTMDVLTPEQRKALKSMRERMRRGRMGMMGMGGDAAGGPMSGKEHRRMMREGDHRRMMEQR
ncbi:MAG TPA: periplasmic heavy metal sensor, partial [Chromatiales bacterium]|nr:periplasmic heavy metal sensor [Chromatiales bacterium]